MERKTVCITGASRGIGKAVAAAFAARHYDLYLTCRKEEALLADLKNYLEMSYAVSCHIAVCDAANPEQTEQFFRQIRRLDVLINNAGVSYRGLLSDMEPDEWDAVIRTNLSSVFYTSRLAIPLMLKQHRGKILNISSVWGCVGASCEAAYSASKGGVNALTRALAKELAPSNIQVNAIACGVIDTEMNQFLDAKERASLEEEIPAGRFGSAQEVAELALALCSGNEYLTGQIIRLDGAWI